MPFTVLCPPTGSVWKAPIISSPKPKQASRKMPNPNPRRLCTFRNNPAVKISISNPITRKPIVWIQPMEVSARELIESRTKLYPGWAIAAAMSSAISTSGPAIPAAAKTPWISNGPRILRVAPSLLSMTFPADVQRFYMLILPLLKGIDNNKQKNSLDL